MPEKIPRARKEILKRAKNAKTKVERAKTIVDVLHEMGLHDMPREITLDIADELGVRKYHTPIKNALRIAKALGRKPETLYEVFEGAEKAGLGHLSERTLLDIAYKGFGIKKDRRQVAMEWYVERIKKALSREPTTVREVFEGARIAGLGYLSYKTLLNIAYRGFGIEMGKKERRSASLTKNVNEVYEHFKRGGKFSWELPHEEGVIKLGIATYVGNHLIGRVPEESIKKILKKKEVPEEWMDEIIEMGKGIKRDLENIEKKKRRRRN